MNSKANSQVAGPLIVLKKNMTKYMKQVLVILECFSFQCYVELSCRTYKVLDYCPGTTFCRHELAINIIWEW